MVRPMFSFLNGSAIPVESGPEISDGLYRNLGSMKFTNVTQPSRANDRLFGMGATVADYDSDGFSQTFSSRIMARIAC